MWKTTHIQHTMATGRSGRQACSLGWACRAEAVEQGVGVLERAFPGTQEPQQRGEPAPGTALGSALGVQPSAELLPCSSAHRCPPTVY